MTMMAGGWQRDVTDMLMGGTSAMFATLFTNPIEVVKTRLQLQGELKARGQHSVHYRGVLHAIYVVGRNEGLVALQRGLPAMLGFQFCLNTFRLGVYRICERRGFTTDSKGKTSLIKGACAAGFGGALGSIAGTPFFLVKTRLQAQAAKSIAVGHQHAHAGLRDALAAIYKKEGLKGLFRGVSPQIPRGAVGSGSQIISFTFAKDWLKENNVTSSPLLLSFLGANLGGIVMTLCLNPFDVVATRLSNQALDSQNRGALYSGMTDCFIKMVRSEGARSLYKGVMANYMRLGPHTVLLLVCWDQLKILENYLRRAMDFVVGGLAGAGATFFSNPFDVVKTRMQLQGELRRRGEHAVFYKNIPHAIATMIRHDGVLSLQQGLLAGMCFSCTVNAVRFGLYTMADKYKLLRDSNGKTIFFNSLVFSAIGGSIAGLFGSPFQLVKTQMMSKSSRQIAVGTQHEHTGLTYAIKSVYDKYGVFGLFRSSHGMMLRNGIGSGAQMSVYETHFKSICSSKEWMTSRDMLQQSRYLSAFVASNLGALVKTAALTPMDVIMTRLYNQGVDEKGQGKLYSGVADCARKIAATEGVMAFYKGMGPTYLRQAPHTVLLLVFWDILKDVQKKITK